MQKRSGRKKKREDKKEEGRGGKCILLRRNRERGKFGNRGRENKEKK